MTRVIVHAGAAVTLKAAMTVQGTGVTIAGSGATLSLTGAANNLVISAGNKLSVVRASHLLSLLRADGCNCAADGSGDVVGFGRMDCLGHVGAFPLDSVAF